MPFSWRRCSLIALIGLVAGAYLGGQRPWRQTYEIKAVYLYQFSQFVEWPSHTFADPSEPMIIGILGSVDPFEGFLHETVAGEQIEGRPFRVRLVRSPEDAGAVHILYIPDSQMYRLNAVLSILKDRPVLTVGEGSGFVQRGGMIQLTAVQSRVRFTINAEAMRRAGLSASARLLRLSQPAAGQPRE